MSGTPPAPPRPRRGFPGPPPLLAAFLATSLLVLAFDLHHWRQLPGEADWQAAAAVVRTGWEPGDVIRLEPWWATQGLPALDGLVLDRLRQPERRVLARWKRVWVIAGFGHGCREGAPEGATLQARQELHRLELCRFSLPWRGEPLYDLRDRLHDARVRREVGKTVEEASLWLKGSWYWGKVHPWQFVGQVAKDVDDNPRRGIWAHAPDKGAHLVIEYPAVPLGRELELEAGLTLRSVLAGEGSDVHLQVRLAGEQVLDITIAPRQKGWLSWPIDTSRWAGRTASLVITVWAKDNQVRQLMFAGRTWEQ